MEVAWSGAGEQGYKLPYRAMVIVIGATYSYLIGFITMATTQKPPLKFTQLPLAANFLDPVLVFTLYEAVLAG